MNWSKTKSSHQEGQVPTWTKIFLLCRLKKSQIARLWLPNTSKICLVSSHPQSASYRELRCLANDHVLIPSKTSCLTWRVLPSYRRHSSIRKPVCRSSCRHLNLAIFPKYQALNSEAKLICWARASLTNIWICRCVIKTSPFSIKASRKQEWRIASTWISRASKMPRGLLQTAPRFVPFTANASQLCQTTVKISKGLLTSKIIT